MKRFTKKALWIITVLLLLVFGICGYLYFFQHISVYSREVYTPKDSIALEKVLQEQEVKEDVSQLIDIIEEVHPIFLEELNSKYQEAKEKFKGTCSKAMTTSQFQLEASKYLSSLEDRHTIIAWRDEEFLDINWIYLDGKLILLDENNKATQKEVVKINGESLETLIKGVRDILPAENYAAENKNIAKSLKRKQVLKGLGIKAEDNVTITIKDGQGSEDITIKYALSSDDTSYSYDISSKKLEDNIFYFKLGICQINDEYNLAIENLKKALNEGITNVIVDVRDNPGGNSIASNKILDILNMKPGRFGAVIRFSPLAQRYVGYLRSSGKVIIKSGNNSRKNEEINLYVITNENTFSSAQWLATLVQDGKLGTIVGAPSSNSPSSYGDILRYQLSNSKIEGIVSHKKFTRPDISKDKENILEPDVKVAFYEDPLQKVIEIIQGR